MKVFIWNFYSQQDKVNKIHKTDSCCTTKMSRFWAERMEDELGWEVTMLSPKRRKGSIPWYRVLEVDLPLNNLAQRFSFFPEIIESLDADLVISHHEFLAHPFKQLSKIQIVTVVGLVGDDPMFKLCWDASDALVAYSPNIAKQCGASLVWTMAYDERDILLHRAHRPIDVLFVQRASATGYSDHEACLEFARKSRLVCKFTDVTGYLKSLGVVSSLLADTRDDKKAYYELLTQSKVVVGTIKNQYYGGFGFVEAVASGACPVCVKTPSYVELLTEDWPYWIYDGDLERALKFAFNNELWHGVGIETKKRIKDTIASISYQRTWNTVKRDLLEVIS